jgi:HK97 gp10 family phage protein
MIKMVNRTGKFMRQMTSNQLEALNNVGKFCVVKMKGYVAIDTGLLQSNCEYVINQNELFLQNKTPYAGFQEYGTYKMTAHPFFKPAVYNHLGEIKAIMIGGMSNGIK